MDQCLNLLQSVGETIGVVGAGNIGTTVAQDLAQHGFKVVLLDRSEESLNRSSKEIVRNVRLYRLYSLPNSNADHDAESVLSRIEFTSDFTRLSAVAFVIENVTEIFEEKLPVYMQLNEICQIGTILAANTSCISIDRIAAASGRPSKVVGLHFMNPSPLKPSVELIAGAETSSETLAIARNLAARLGKRAVPVRDAPGFVCNRVMSLAINEAIELVRDGVAEAHDIDYLFKSAYGHKMGPLETADFIGLDTILYSIEVLHRDTGASKFCASPLLRDMVAKGQLGRKSGRGFYDYSRIG
jgi:3-hydroxybutyryl-CoA dehydrogenase